MQTIVRNETNISLYYLTDSKTVDITSTETTISEGGTPEFIIADCNSSNATLHTDVDEQATWWGWKYKHDGSSWSANTDYVGINILSSSVNDSVTTIPVGNTNPFTASGTVQINDEKITYTGVDGTNLTGCTRGTASTDAASHISGDTVTQI
jgi:hypothetical protein